jgi:hypothetical protein
MVVSVNHVLDNMRHALGGGDLSIELDKLGILNQAGEFMVNMHPWQWLIGREGLINLKGPISDTTGTWTAASSTLTDTGAFASYTFQSGDQIEIISGTGATTGFYEISSRTDDDSIVLATSLASGNLATGDISWKIRLNYAALPTDFRSVIDITATDAVLYGVRLTSLAEILRNRTSQVEVTTSWNYQVAVNYVGSPPVPQLEVWPDPGSDQNGVWTLFYHAGWTRLTSDSVNIDIPEFIDSLYLRIARAFALGYEREDVASMEQRLGAIAAGPEFRAAAKRDGEVQPFYGRIVGGGPQIHGRTIRRSQYGSIANTVAAPS